MTAHFLPPFSDAYEAAVDDAIATCNGDLRGALKALIIANEFLERDLQAAASTSGLFCRELIRAEPNGARTKSTDFPRPDVRGS
jgi:hypothetical protein